MDDAPQDSQLVAMVEDCPGGNLHVTMRLASGGRSAFQTLALWLGLVALTIQGLAPLCLSGMMASSDGHSVIICTAHGFETRTLGADGKPINNAPDSGHQSSDCPLCSVCHTGGGLTAPPQVHLALPSFVEYAASRPVYAPSISSTSHASYVSRAPPVAAIAVPV